MYLGPATPGRDAFVANDSRLNLGAFFGHSWTLVAICVSQTHSSVKVCPGPCRGARTRPRRAVTPARFAIPRERPHRARRTLATEHTAPRWLSTAKCGEPGAERAWAAGPSPPIPCPHAPPTRPPFAAAGLPTRSPQSDKNDASFVPRDCAPLAGANRYWLCNRYWLHSSQPLPRRGWALWGYLPSLQMRR